MDLVRALVPADTAGEKRVKRMLGLGGSTGSATRQRQQQHGIWCPTCHHYHRVGSPCGAAGKDVKAPKLESKDITTGRQVNATRG
jgi:hypothetical protein